MTALASDISDGVFDGKGPSGATVSYCSGNLPALAGISDFQDALSGLNELQEVTAAFAFGGSGNILTTNGLADVATGGSTAYPLAPLATINGAIPQAAPTPVDSFATSGDPTMTTVREDATATLLPSGQVLIAGGLNNGTGGQGNPTSSAELYNPSTNTFDATGSMTTARFGATATLLPNGKVLIAGGATGSLPCLSGCGFPATTISSAEVYDPASGTFTATSNSMTSERAWATATLLPNGKVLVAGGQNLGGVPVSGTDLYTP